MVNGAAKTLQFRLTARTFYYSEVTITAGEREMARPWEAISQGPLVAPNTAILFEIRQNFSGNWLMIPLLSMSAIRSIAS
jgi:hypothetical protein